MCALGISKGVASLLLASILAFSLLLLLPGQGFAASDVGARAESLSKDETAFAHQQNQPLVVTVVRGDVPLGGPFAAGVWSLFSLFLSILGFILGVAQLVRLLLECSKRELEIERKERGKCNGYGVYGKRNTCIGATGKQVEVKTSARIEHLIWLRVLLIASVVFAALPLALFLILDNISLPVVWINENTVAVTLAFLIELVLILVTIGNQITDHGIMDV